MVRTPRARALAAYEAHSNLHPPWLSGKGINEIEPLTVYWPFCFGFFFWHFVNLTGWTAGGEQPRSKQHSWPHRLCKWSDACYVLLPIHIQRGGFAFHLVVSRFFFFFKPKLTKCLLSSLSFRVGPEPSATNGKETYQCFFFARPPAHPFYLYFFWVH